MAGYIDPWHTPLQSLHQTQSDVKTTTPSPSLTSSNTSSLKPSTSSQHSRHASPPPTSSLTSVLRSLLPTSRSHRRQKQNHHHATLLAHTYLSSCPLPPNLPAQKDIYCFCRHLLQNDPISPGSITHYIPILKHRLKDLSTATRYKNLLNLSDNFPDCYGFDFGKWKDDHEISSTATISSKNELGKNKRDSGYGYDGTTSSSTKSSITASKMEKRFQYSLSHLLASHLLTPVSPSKEQGPVDLKPVYYLSAALAASGLSSKAIRATIEQLMVGDVIKIGHYDRVAREGVMDRCSCHGRRCMWCLVTTSNGNGGREGTNEGDWEDISLE
ncbi:MAG: hypothetical protein Q9226_000790 [Calogaya cf. arnoldii]